MEHGLMRQIDMGNETVARVVQAAEELFAEFGHENVSLRQLTARAGVNVAAVNYYFGSKQALTEMVFERLAQQAAAYRRAALERVAQSTAEPDQRLEELIRAFVWPYLGDGNEVSGRLLSRFFLRHRLHPTEGTKWITDTHHNPIALDYMNAISELCPSLPETEVVWRYFFMVNTVIISSAEDTSFERLTVLSGNRISNTDRVQRREALIGFLVSAVRNP